MSAFPRVERDEDSAEFFDAAARGELLLGRSADSGTVLPPGAGTGSVVASGEGTLVSWAVVHRAPLPALADAVPYVTAVVELAEGPWVFARLLVDEPGALRAGTRVRAVFVRSGEQDEGEVVPAFEPA